MKGLFALAGMSLGGWLGWWLGGFVGLGTAVLLSAAGSAFGLWAARRVGKTWLE